MGVVISEQPSCGPSAFRTSAPLPFLAAEGDLSTVHLVDEGNRKGEELARGHTASRSESDSEGLCVKRCLRYTAWLKLLRRTAFGCNFGQGMSFLELLSVLIYQAEDGLWPGLIVKVQPEGWGLCGSGNQSVPGAKK